MCYVDTQNLIRTGIKCLQVFKTIPNKVSWASFKYAYEYIYIYIYIACHTFSAAMLSAHADFAVADCLDVIPVFILIHYQLQVVSH